MLNASRIPTAQASSRIIIITGASSGIGKAMADQLSLAGNRVYALARSLPDFFSDPGQERISGSGCLRPVRLDVTQPEQVRLVLDRIIGCEGRVDVLVQAAGYGLAGAVEDASPAEIQAQITTNFISLGYVLPPVLSQMRRQQSGLIVQLSSVAGFMPIPFQAYYTASKAAATAMMLALANEIRPYGIRCLVVQPGDTRTGFTGARMISRAAAGSSYQDRCSRSIAKMAADESRGVPADRMARLIIRKMDRRRPPLVYTPGLLYRTAYILQRLLPVRLVNAVLYRMYAC